MKLVFALSFIAVLLVAGCLGGGNGTPQPSVQNISAEPQQEPEPQLPVQNASTEPPNVPTQTGTAEVVSLNAYETGYFVKVFGEVKNTGKIPMQFVSVNISFRGKNGTMRTDEMPVTMRYLEPGWVSPFSLTLFRSEVTDMESFSANVADMGEVKNPFYTGLQVITHKGRGFGSDGYYRAEGTVKNTGDKPSKFAHAVVTFYDASGKVVDSGVSPIASGAGSIAPGKEQSFSVQGQAPKNSTITEYAVAISYDNER